MAVAVSVLAILSLLVAKTAAQSIPFGAMSFNIRWDNDGDGANRWKVRYPYVIEEVLRKKPALVGYQEVLYQQRVLLEARLGSTYSFYGVGRDDAKNEGEIALASWDTERFTAIDQGEFWLSETPDVPSKGWDATCCNRICTWVVLQDKVEGNELMFLNAHYDHQGVVAREESSKLIMSFIEENWSGKPVVLMGDFNAPVSGLGGPSAPYDAFVPPLIDTYRAIYDEGENPEGTFNGWTDDTSGDRIDWVLVSDHYDTVQASIENQQIYDGRNPSDHWAVTATLDMSGGVLKSVYEVICTLPDYSILCSLVDQLGLDSALSGGTWTVFAPSNTAFDNVPPIPAEKAEDVVVFHAVANQELRSSDLVCKELVGMANGKDSRTFCSGTKVFQKGGDNTDSNNPEIISVDYIASNGVLHFVNNVMLPEGFLPAE